MRLAKTIVNEANNLIGFVVEGTGKEFNEKDTIGVIYKSVLLEELIRVKFSNEQARVKENKLEYLEDFKPNNLPMMKYAENKLIDMDNIAIYKGIFRHNNKLGCELLIEGEIRRYTYEDTVKLSTWFELIDGSSGEKVDLEKNKDEFESREKAIDIKDKYEEPIKIVKDEKDILTLIDIIKKTFGVIILDKAEQYKAEQYNVFKVDEEFIRGDVGDVAAPFFVYTEEYFNATLPFKAVGHVTIDYNNQKIDVPTYIHRAKKLIDGGEVKIKHVIIGLTSEGMQEVIKVFGRNFLNEVYKNDAETEKIEAIINMKRGERPTTGPERLEYFRVDLSKLPVITKYNARKYLMNNKEVMKLVKMLNNYKLQMKFLRGQEKELLEFADKCKIRILDSYILGTYVGYDNRYLAALLKAGIDLRTGEYRRVTIDYSKYSETDTPKPGVIYEIKGDNIGSVSYEDIKFGKKHRLISNDLLELVDILENTQDLNVKYEIIYGLKKQINSNIDYIKSKLWLHKLAIYKFGNELNPMEGQYWKFEKLTKKYKVFSCIEEGCEGLQMKIRVG